MRRLEFVLNIPSPYRVTLLEEVARQAAGRGYAFEAHFMSHGHQDRPDSWRDPKMSFPHRYWRDWGRGTHHFNPGLLWHLLTTRIDAIYVGGAYDNFTSILAPFCLAWQGTTRCVGMEGNTRNVHGMNGVLGWFKRWTLSHWQYAAVPGAEGRGYIALHQQLTKRRMPKVVILPNLIDETRFVTADHYESTELQAVRACMGAKVEDRLCVIPSRLSPEKGVLPFFRLLDRQLLAGWHLAILGKGVEEPEIRRLMVAGGYADRVTILDYVPYEDMPKYYAASDLMLLPSLRDQNPLAVVEALHCGLPIALSDQAGNIDEAISEGRNGWSLPINDATAFARKLKKVFLTSCERLREMGRSSKSENAAFWDSQRAVAAFLDGIGVGSSGSEN